MVVRSYYLSLLRALAEGLPVAARETLNATWLWADLSLEGKYNRELRNLQITKA